MANHVHIGKKSWWSGEVTTLCGLKFGKNNNKEVTFSWGVCPACKAAKKRGVKL